MNYTLVLILGYAAIMVAAGLLLSKNKTPQDFLVAGRKNPAFIMAAGLIIGWIDPLWFTLFSGMGYSMGWAFLWLIAGIFAGILCLDIQSAKVKAISTEYNMLTVTDWYYHHFGTKTGRIVGAMVSLNFLGWLAAVFVSSGLIISSVFNLDYALVIICSALVILPLLLKGGYASLTRFDVLQFFVVAIGLTLIYTLGFKEGVKIAVPEPDTLGTLGLFGSISIAITFFCAFFCGSDAWQRLYAARDVREVQLGFKWLYVLAAIMLLATALFGMTARMNGFNGGEGDVFTFVFKELLTAPAQMIFLLILMAALISTLNVAIFTSAISMAKDFFRKEVTEEILQKRVKFLMVFVVLIAAGGALLTQDIMQLGLAVMSFPACMAPVLIISVMTNIRLSDYTGFISILVAVATYLGLLITGNMKPEYSALPFVINLAVLVIVETICRVCSKYRTG